MFLINASLLHLYRVLQDMNVIQTCQNVNFIIIILIMSCIKGTSNFYLFIMCIKSIYGDFGHCANKTHENVEAFAEHVFNLCGLLERPVHMNHKLIF